MTDKKPCVLEGAVPGEPAHTHEGEASDHPRPCALLRSEDSTAPAAPPEDESADPVGDGHSDAEFAAEHPVPPEKKGPQSAGH